MKRAVVDQPGLKIILVGLVIAIFLGLSIRSQITSHKINLYLKNLIQGIQEKNKDQNLVIDFSEGRLKLSDWGMPFPHLVINNIKVSSLNSQCSDNQLYIDFLDVPFSWSNLFFSKMNFQNFVDIIRVSQAELRLNNIAQCLNSKSQVNSANTNINRASKGNERSLSSVASPSPEVYGLNLFFEKIKIIDKHNYNLPIMLQAMSVKLGILENELRHIEAKSQMFLFKDVERSHYQVRTDLNFYYSKTVKKEISADLNLYGKLIDKTFDLKLNYDNENEKIIIGHTMSDLSLKALVKLFQKNDLGESLHKQVEGITGLALSSKGHGEYNLKDPQASFYEVTDIVISSGDSNITSENINITSFKPFVFSPFKVSLNKFDLEKVKSIGALTTVQKSINNFGNVTGVIHVHSNGKVTSEGVVSDLEFIFSNRGRRANQKIDQIRFVVDESKLLLTDLVLENKKVIGDVQINMSSSSMNRKFDLKLSEIKLSDAVYDIFSFNQDKKTLISLSAQLENHLFKAQLKFDQLVSDHFEVKHAEVNYTASIDPISQRIQNPILDLQIKNLRINKKETNDLSFYSVLDELELDPTIKDYYFDAIKSNYTRKDANLFNIYISANYFSKLKNEKILVDIDSQYVDPANAIFNLNAHQGDKKRSVQIQADLNRFSFELKK